LPAEPHGRRLSEADAFASNGGSGNSASAGSNSVASTTGTRTSLPTSVNTAVEGPITVVDAGSDTGATTIETGTWPDWPLTQPTTQPCHWPWDCKFPPHSPPPPHEAPPPPPPHKPRKPHKERKPVKIPIRRSKEVKVIIVPPKPVPKIPVCQGKIKESCCDSKDYCPWNWHWYPDKEPPKVCKVEVEVIKELKLCQWPVLVWKDEYDFTCKCPETPEPCPSCNACFVQSSASAFASADASGSSGYGG